MPQDKITLDRISKLHPKVREEATQIYNEIVAALTGNATVRFAQGLRTFTEQDALYAQGRTKPGSKVTNAKGGQSIHNYGLAIDIVLLVDTNKDGIYETASWDRLKDFDGDKVADWMEIVKIFKSYGWEWGGDWTSLKDYPHFEKSFGKTWQQLQVLHNNKKVDKDGYVII